MAMPLEVFSSGRAVGALQTHQFLFGAVTAVVLVTGLKPDIMKETA